MAMVIGVAAVMMLLIATMSASSVSGLVKATHDEDWNAAIEAAYAGISDYQGRLANDYTYVQYGNPASTFGAGSAGRSIALPSTTNPAFGVGVDGTWATLAGSGGNASYRYEVDNSSYSATGVLRIRATGRVGTTTRSVVADLKQKGFIDYLYFTDYEIRDHDFSQDDDCLDSDDDAQYSWQISGGHPSKCLIQFIAGDKIDGPMHSNDTMVMCGGTFTGAVTTANNILVNSKRYSTVGCANPVAPTFTTSTSGPVYAKTITFPQTNDSMQQETRTDLPLTVQRAGCLYTGPTTITFNGAYMTIRSPWTKATQVKGDNPATSGTTPDLCGKPGNPSLSEDDNKNTLAGALGVTIPVLDHNLIYVQSVPTDATKSIDPNYWAAGVYPNKLNQKTYCVGATGNSSPNGNGVGFPSAGEMITTTSAYNCQYGDVFVKGSFDAAMTIAAARYVYVTGNLTRQDTQNDILGLVGTNAVWVWNPVNSSSDTILTDNERKIEAAILSVGHSFQVQNYNLGDFRGKLTVVGSIAQKFRGTVGTGSGSAQSGYNKNYVYDPRFHAIAPPKFLSPVSTTYGINVLVEVKTAFTSTGAVAP
jgi:hypothetical protein